MKTVYPPTNTVCGGYNEENIGALNLTRTVRGSDYSPTIELSEQKDKLVTATGDTENILKNKPTKSG